MIGGAGTQHFTFGAVVARFSRASRPLGRWLIQTWSCASTVMPPMVPMIQFDGSVCGQVGSTSNFGTFCAAAGASVASARTQESITFLTIRFIASSSVEAGYWYDGSRETSLPPTWVASAFI